ncbi:uncharacterized protein LOC136026250 isoform X2 [Artemia franciscana]|uniref:uncharacterized protein LOC136026250 isoform X2 n=1 Tax=Artemia franciscana TaxID=6661 RepID=UPI0032D9DECF
MIGIVTLTIFLHSFLSVELLRIQGTWDTGQQFFHFITKFGFQKTLLQNQLETQGYVFGNISSDGHGSKTYTFALLDRGYFLGYYGNSSLIDRNKACQTMFYKIDSIAYDSTCNDEGKEDFLRKVPCPVSEVCVDEDQPNNVIPGSQLTFAVQDLIQPRFWYLSLVACTRNSTTCQWEAVKDNATINYDLWLVNGNPRTSSHPTFDYHFSVEMQGIAEIYLVCFACYGFLAPLQLYAIWRQKHAIPKLFTASILFVTTGLFFNMVQAIEFAGDGTGIDGLQILGDILDILSQIEVAVIENINPYQTLPGWLILVLRVAIMIWFLLCLRQTMIQEKNRRKLDFFLHFGASSLVWFIYLPIVALISFQVSPLFRQKLLIGITYSANFLANAALVQLLWPTRSEQYFLLSHEKFYDEELEEFNEAPHVLNSATSQDSIATQYDRNPINLIPAISHNGTSNSTQELIKI